MVQERGLFGKIGCPACKWNKGTAEIPICGHDAGPRLWFIHCANWRPKSGDLADRIFFERIGCPCCKWNKGTATAPQCKRRGARWWKVPCLDRTPKKRGGHERNHD